MIVTFLVASTSIDMTQSPEFSNKQESHSLHAIGSIKTPFMEKFAVPRQPNLIPSITSQIIINVPYGVPEAFEGIEQFSHIWVLFRFHQNLDKGWQPRVRPPRLGGNKKIGVFATRSSFRPNGIGMSVAKLLQVDYNNEQTTLTVSGLDVVNDTPVYDIKPYIGYTDAPDNVSSGFAPTPPELIAVEFTPEALAQLNQLSDQASVLQIQLKETLAQDPRPAYRRNKAQDNNEYGVSFAGLNVRWQVRGGKIVVIAVTKA